MRIHADPDPKHLKYMNFFTGCGLFVKAKPKSIFISTTYWVIHSNYVS